MKGISMSVRRKWAAAAVIVFGASVALSSAGAQTPGGAAAAGPSPAKQAIESRKAIFTLIGNNFRPLGNVAKGAQPFDAADVQKRAARVAFLADLLSETFPEASNLGEPETKTKADAWTNHADFEKKLKEFSAHAAAFVQTAAAEKSATDAFKSAVAALGQDCKGCHDSYKAK